MMFVLQLRKELYQPAAAATEEEEESRRLLFFIKKREEQNYRFRCNGQQLLVIDLPEDVYQHLQKITDRRGNV